MSSAVSSAQVHDPRLAQALAENAELKAANRAQREQLQSLQQQLDWFKRQLFGQRSERRLVEPSPDQLSLADALGARSQTAEPPTRQTITYTRGKAAKRRPDEAVNDSGLRYDESVPVERIEHTPAELLGEAADDYEVIGERVTRRLAQRPGSYVVLEHVRPVLRRKVSEDELITPPAPAAVLEGTQADVSVLAGLLVDKFCHHLPLYRQHQRMSQAGITLSRATLTQWVRRSIALLAPIHEAQLRHILRSRTLAMDETPIRAGRSGKGRMKQAWYWPIYGEADEVSFTYASSRGRQHVLETLHGFQGTLLCDGYSAYAHFAGRTDGVELAQCWAHTRRHFERARDSDPEAADRALELIGTLYRVEAEIRQRTLDAGQTLALRTERSLPVVDAFYAWCYEQRQRLDLVNSHPLSKALKYASEREHALRVFLSAPHVAIDTNHLERALRTIPMGRKNWLFCWTEVGAEQVGIIQSLLTTCRLHDINPYTYLVDVLQRVAIHPASEVEQLTPRRWKQLFADKPLRSDLGHAR